MDCEKNVCINMELNLFFFSFNCICHSSKWFFWFVFFFLHFTNLNVSPVTPVTYISQQQNKTGNSVLDMSSLGESEVTISTAENQGSFCGRLAAAGQRFSLTHPDQQSFRQRRLLQWWGFVQLSTYPSVFSSVDLDGRCWNGDDEINISS